MKNLLIVGRKYHHRIYGWAAWGVLVFIDGVYVGKNRKIQLGCEQTAQGVLTLYNLGTLKDYSVSQVRTEVTSMKLLNFEEDSAQAGYWEEKQEVNEKWARLKAAGIIGAGLFHYDKNGNVV